MRGLSNITKGNVISELAARHRDSAIISDKAILNS